MYIIFYDIILNEYKFWSIIKKKKKMQNFELFTFSLNDRPYITITYINLSIIKEFPKWCITVVNKVRRLCAIGINIKTNQFVVRKILPNSNNFQTYHTFHKILIASKIDCLSKVPFHLYTAYDVIRSCFRFQLPYHFSNTKHMDSQNSKVST